MEIASRSGHYPAGHKYYIKSENLARKAFSQRITKAKLLDFSGCVDVTDRNEAESYLPDDVSIIIAQNKKTHDHLYMSRLLRYTDTNSFEYIEKAAQSSSQHIIQSCLIKVIVF